MQTEYISSHYTAEIPHDVFLKNVYQENIKIMLLLSKQWI